MKFYFRIVCFLLLFFCCLSSPLFAQKKLEKQLSDSLTVIANSYVSAVGRVNVLGISNSPNSILITASEKLAYLSFRPELVARIYASLAKVLAPQPDSVTLVCQVNNKRIEDLIPNFYRTNFIDQQKQFSVTVSAPPLCTPLSRPYDLSNGLQRRHIALWQSHGLFFEQKTNKWRWQRPRVMQVVEDLYTQSFVLPYLLPMLENAGANVLIPRERDTQLQEVIVDNDVDAAGSVYKEQNAAQQWLQGDSVGFANRYLIYRKFENPFRLGSYRKIQSVSVTSQRSSAEWIPLIPEKGFYAVYVAYKSLENSSSNAHYTVFHKGGKSDFLVNQKIGGGTWIYLGRFQFDAGQGNQGKVVLTNLGGESGTLVTADAVKFGGGMGTIARERFQQEPIPSLLQFGDTLHLSTDSLCPLPIPTPLVSSYPRFAEGARYWLQWAGVPDTVYSKTQGRNDYLDDFQSRGNWVNYLTGSSVNAPFEKGLGIPLDLVFAFHTDAGMTPNDSIIGSLGICTISNSQGETIFKNGISRWASRDLTDIVHTQIVNDIRSQFAPEWSNRGMWNKSYSEARVPQVPTMLLELLSHQNFADMRYGLDPRFRFSVSRSIYKGMLKYLAAANGFEYIVQPLPVTHFSCKFTAKNTVELHWEAVVDSLEPSALPTQFMVYTRVDKGGFDNGILVQGNRCKFPVESGKVYSFKIAAVNKGGESFPSEILSCYRAPIEKGELLIVNGFTRLSAPASFNTNGSAGFLPEEEPGVPYLSEISYVGKQLEFNRSKPYLDDENPGFGASASTYEAKLLGGNSFDYPFLHGAAIKAANYSYVSCGSDALLSGYMHLTDYKQVDLILGAQKQTLIGNGKKRAEFETFPLALQSLIEAYCKAGGNLLVSGAYLSAPNSSAAQDTLFLNRVLRCKFNAEKACLDGKVKFVNFPFKQFEKRSFGYASQPNPNTYTIGAPNSIEPIGEGAATFCRFETSNLSAAVAFSGKYKLCTFGFPFELIEKEEDRSEVMKDVLNFFSLKEKGSAKRKSKD